MKNRIFVIFFGFFMLWSLVVLRAFYIQVLPNEKLSNFEKKKFETRIKLNSQRGHILDTNLKELALSQHSWSIYADPSKIKEPKKMAKVISKITKSKFDVNYQKLKDSKKKFVWIQRFLDTNQEQQFKDAKLEGFSLIPEWKRVYPYDVSSTSLLGVTGQEGNGLEGLELKYDDKLSGDSEKVSVKRDARGRPINLDGLLLTENQSGKDIILTIDSDIQFFLEEQLKSAVKEFEGQGAFGVIMDPTNGELKALVSVENEQTAIPKLRTVTDGFEPGSTMKPFIVALGIESGLYQPNSKVFCENGKMKVGDRWIKESDAKHQFGFLSLSEILAFSSNIGAAKVGFQMGDQLVRDGLEKFGFGKKSAIDFPGEARGTLHPLPWNNHLLANISFGQGIAVNAVQITSAFSALINGGILRAPRLVRSIRDRQTLEVEPNGNVSERQVISKKTSDVMKVLLSSVTHDGGTGVNAKVAGFMIGGKTGTAQKPSTKFRGYEPNAYLSSFMGFFPVHDPKYVIFVLVDSPKKSIYGSQVAAPVFSRTASYLARKEGLVPNLISDKNLIGFEKVKKTKNSRDLSSETVMRPSLTVQDVIKNLKDNDAIEFIGKGSKVDYFVEENLDQSKKVRVYLRNNSSE